MRPHGRVRISRSKPNAQGVCDRCGLWYNHRDLMWQFDWVGARLQNLRILVCKTCRDKPQENIRTIILPADPMPVQNPRPESFPSDNNPISGIGFDPAGLWNPPGSPSPYSTTFGSMLGGGGPESCFFGAPKVFAFSASLTPSSTSISPGNSVGVNWSKIPGNPTTPRQLSTPVQSYVVNSTTVQSPIDAPFLGSGTTNVFVEGSNDGVVWTQIGTAPSLGVKNESLTITSPNSQFYGYHRVRVAGDGATPAAISFIQFSTPGPSLAQTGSELGA